MTKEGVKDLRVRILQGIDLSNHLLLITKQINNEELVISRNGKIVKVKASEFLGQKLLNIS